MKLAIDCAKLLCFCALILLLGEAAYAIHRLRPKAELTLTHINRATIAAGAAAGNVEKASRQWETAAKAQAEESTAVLVATKNVLAQVQKSVNNMDTSIGSVSLQLSTTIVNQDRSLLETQQALRENLSQMQQVTIQLQDTLASADKLISSPELQKSLASLAEASNNTAIATANLAASTKDVQIVADKFREDFVKPKNRAWAYFKSVLDLGSKAKILF